MERKDRYAAIEASRVAREGESEHWPALDATPRLEWQDRLMQTAESSVVALRAVLEQLSPAPAWRSEVAEMAAAALGAAKGLVDKGTWVVGWKLVYLARKKPGGRDYGPLAANARTSRG